jgi:hypothetical protein
MLPVNTRLRRKIILLSPFAIIALGHLTARLAGIALGVWAWIPLTLVLWSAFASLIAWGGGRDAIGRWLRRPHGAWGWSALAMVVGLLPLPIFLLNYQLLTPAWIWLPWLVFASINPWLEEGYWRGLLLDATAEWRLVWYPQRQRSVCRQPSIDVWRAFDCQSSSRRTYQHFSDGIGVGYCLSQDTQFTVDDLFSRASGFVQSLRGRISQSVGAA